MHRVLLVNVISHVRLSYCDGNKNENRENFIGSETVEGKDKDRGWIDADIFGKLQLIEYQQPVRLERQKAISCKTGWLSVLYQRLIYHFINVWSLSGPTETISIGSPISFSMYST